MAVYNSHQRFNSLPLYISAQFCILIPVDIALEIKYALVDLRNIYSPLWDFLSRDEITNKCIQLYPTGKGYYFKQYLCINTWQ